MGLFLCRLTQVMATAHRSGRLPPVPFPVINSTAHFITRRAQDTRAIGCFLETSPMHRDPDALALLQRTLGIDPFSPVPDLSRFIAKKWAPGDVCLHQEETPDGPVAILSVRNVRSVSWWLREIEWLRRDRPHGTYAAWDSLGVVILAWGDASAALLDIQDLLVLGQAVVAYLDAPVALPHLDGASGLFIGSEASFTEEERRTHNNYLAKQAAVYAEIAALDFPPGVLRPGPNVGLKRIHCRYLPFGSHQPVSIRASLDETTFNADARPAAPLFRFCSFWEPIADWSMVSLATLRADAALYEREPAALPLLAG